MQPSPERCLADTQPMRRRFVALAPQAANDNRVAQDLRQLGDFIENDLLVARRTRWDRIGPGNVDDRRLTLSTSAG